MNRLKFLIILGVAASLWLAACSTNGGATPQTQNKTAQEDQANSPLSSRSNGAGESPDSDQPTSAERDFQIITLLPRDAIPAIDDPEFYSAQDAEAEYDPDEQIIGVAFDGEARAYSTAKLSRHEIVNDTVAGRKIAVTW